MGQREAVGWVNMVTSFINTEQPLLCRLEVTGYILGSLKKTLKILLLRSLGTLGKMSFKHPAQRCKPTFRTVKNMFDELLENDIQYKAHKVRSGIIMTNGLSVNDAKVVAFGTGTKCFSNIQQDENGSILHDMHAEVLARRGFVRFLIDQLEAMAGSKF